MGTSDGERMRCVSTAAAVQQKQSVVSLRSADEAWLGCVLVDQCQGETKLVKNENTD